MMRLQLALNVPDLTAAVDFYSRLFGVQVAKTKPGYANFEISQPPLKLVLFETDAPQDRLNHLGVEVFDDAEVEAAATNQRNAGLAVEMSDKEGCCFAVQNKAVTYAPDGTMWEWYRKLEDLEGFADSAAAPATPASGLGCC
ncbi:MAG: ArsI/CadI family heavy metal resistance metalloenzyme [Pseudomonadota bacterium]